MTRLSAKSLRTGAHCIEKRYADARETDDHVLILVQSSVDALKRRDSNRDTWMQWQSDYPQIKVFFVVGRGEDVEADVAAVVVSP